jgi:hypothetical protein
MSKYRTSTVIYFIAYSYIPDDFVTIDKEEKTGVLLINTGYGLLVYEHLMFSPSII